jgi:hypothetical protein
MLTLSMIIKFVCVVIYLSAVAMLLGYWISKI